MFIVINSDWGNQTSRKKNKQFLLYFVTHISWFDYNTVIFCLLRLFGAWSSGSSRSFFSPSKSLIRFSPFPSTPPNSWYAHLPLFLPKCYVSFDSPYRSVLCSACHQGRIIPGLERKTWIYGPLLEWPRHLQRDGVSMVSLGSRTRSLPTGNIVPLAGLHSKDDKRPRKSGRQTGACLPDELLPGE